MLEQRPWLFLQNADEELREQEGHPAPLTAEVVLDVRVVPLAGQDDQVTGSIVGAVAVTVMHHFTIKQRTAQQRFGN